MNETPVNNASFNTYAHIIRLRWIYKYKQPLSSILLTKGDAIDGETPKQIDVKNFPKRLQRVAIFASVFKLEHSLYYVCVYKISCGNAFFRKGAETIANIPTDVQIWTEHLRWKIVPWTIFLYIDGCFNRYSVLILTMWFNRMDALRIGNVFTLLKFLKMLKRWAMRFNKWACFMARENCLKIFK